MRFNSPTAFGSTRHEVIGADGKAMEKPAFGDVARRDRKEGTFFEVGDTILSAHAKTEYFSRDK